MQKDNKGAKESYSKLRVRTHGGAAGPGPCMQHPPPPPPPPGFER